MYNLYLYSKKSILTNISFRGIMVSKKRTKINKKQVLIFLRSPKHFNIGKRKVISFNNKVNFFYTTDLRISTSNLRCNLFFLNILTPILKFDALYRLNSVRVVTKTDISWK